MVRTSVDKSSKVPYYEQLREILEDAMRSGEFTVGTQLPSEAQLGDTYDVSRTVVRQALAELTNEGLIHRYKGRGSFVAPPKVDEHLVQSLVGLAEEVSARGDRLENRIRLFERQTPSAQVAQVLELDPDEQVVRLDRVRAVNGEPWVYTSTFLPARRCGELLSFDMRHRSLYATLEHDLGIVLMHGVRTIEAGLAGVEHAALLGIAPTDPVLLLKSVSFDADDRPIEYFLAWHRGDRSRFDVRLRRNDERGDGSGTIATTFAPT